MPTNARATGIKLWLAMAVIYVVWGSTYFGIAIAIQTIPPFFMAAIRFVLAGAALIASGLQMLAASVLLVGEGVQIGRAHV